MRTSPSDITNSPTPVADCVPVFETFGMYSRMSWTGAASACASRPHIRVAAMAASANTARRTPAADRAFIRMSGGPRELAGAQQRTQLHHGGSVDLAHARFRNFDHAADLFERQLFVVVQVQHQPIARRQRIDGRAQSV